MCHIVVQIVCHIVIIIYNILFIFACRFQRKHVGRFHPYWTLSQCHVERKPMLSGA